jgi:hypothetical protein
MCGGGGGKAPRQQPRLPEAPQAPDPNTSERQRDRNGQRRRAGGTVLTSSQGVTTLGATSEKTLLGT